MRKLSLPLLLLFVFGLTQCQDASRKKLTGVWQLKDMTVNGTVLKGSSLGNWLWEFNAVGGFLTDVAGMREKGLYTLKDNTLTLEVTVPQKMADQVYKVAKLDSVELDLLSTDPQNKSVLRFMKRKASEVIKEDND